MEGNVLEKVLLQQPRLVTQRLLVARTLKRNDTLLDGLLDLAPLAPVGIDRLHQEADVLLHPRRTDLGLFGLAIGRRDLPRLLRQGLKVRLVLGSKEGRVLGFGGRGFRRDRIVGWFRDQRRHIGHRSDIPVPSRPRLLRRWCT